MTDTTTAWETDHGTLVLFADVLVTTGCLIEPREVVDFFDRPHKWSPEFHAWHRNGSPVGVKVSVPASASASGVPGQWAADSSYHYVCTATNTWVRHAVATW